MLMIPFVLCMILCVCEMMKLYSVDSESYWIVVLNLSLCLHVCSSWLFFRTWDGKALKRYIFLTILSERLFLFDSRFWFFVFLFRILLVSVFNSYFFTSDAWLSRKIFRHWLFLASWFPVEQIQVECCLDWLWKV